MANRHTQGHTYTGVIVISSAIAELKKCKKKRYTTNFSEKVPYLECRNSDVTIHVHIHDIEIQACVNYKASRANGCGCCLVWIIM